MQQRPYIRHLEMLRPLMGGGGIVGSEIAAGEALALRDQSERRREWSLWRGLRWALGGTSSLQRPRESALDRSGQSISVVWLVCR